MSGLTAAVGGGIGGSDWSIVDPASVAPGSSSLVGGMAMGSSDYMTPTVAPVGTAAPVYAQSASTIVAPYGTTAAAAAPVTSQAFQNATTGQAALGGGAAANQDRVLYAHVAAPPAPPAPPEPPKEHEVKPGDTLSKLAGANGTTWEKLYELNKDVIGPNPDLIKPGQKLKLA